VSDHRGQYADERHDHDGDYAQKYHRHHDDESTVRGLREDLGHAEERIRELEDAARQWRQDADERIRALDGHLRGALAFIRVLDRLRPTCVICHDETADRQTVRGPACTDCAGDLPDDGPDPDRRETWVFGDVPDSRGGTMTVSTRCRIARACLAVSAAALVALAFPPLRHHAIAGGWGIAASSAVSILACLYYLRITRRPS
jgi:hypothetical protein